MRSRSVARDPDDRGFNLAACRASVKEGQVITVNTGTKGKTKVTIVKEYPTYMLCRRKAKLGSYDFCMTYDEYWQDAEIGIKIEQEVF